jgi:serine/threonine protein kinase
VTFAATLLFGRTDATTVLEAMVADLTARGAIDATRAAQARERVNGGWLPSTALLDVGTPPEAVLHALSSVAGVPPAPPSHAWNADARAHLSVDEVVWQRLMAVPIGFVENRPLVAFADVGRVASSAALGLPDHVACMALEPDIRSVLSRKAQQQKSTQIAFLAPPSAVASALPVGGQAAAFNPGTAPNLAGTMVGAAPASNPAAMSSPLAPPVAVETSQATAFMGSIPLLQQKATQVASFGGQASAPLGTSPFSDQPRAFSATPSTAPIPQNTQVAAMFNPPPAKIQGLSLGQRVGRFVLERKLGEGGMATVFVGTDTMGGPQAAIKVVHEHLLTSNVGEEVRRRFQREVGAMRQLEHKNIVACLDAGRVGDTEYIATELMTGGSLSELLKRIGKVSPMLALSFFGDFLEGLAHAHDKGVVHRDLKPDNLLLDASGAIKIADFGIARVAEGTQLTATGGIIGTPSYMSPEQALAQPVDQRTDLYSAGVILYELITGRNPFEGDSVMATLGAVLAGNVRPIGEVEPSVPFVVDLVLHKLLSLRPDDRFPTAHAVLKALAPALEKAKQYRELWMAVASKTPGKLAEACNKEASAYAAIAKRERDARFRSALAAFRARSLHADNREAKNVLTQLESGGPLKFSRSTSPELFARESAVDGLPVDQKRAAYKELAQLYLSEGNPQFCAQYLRRAVMSGAIIEEDLKALATVLPDDEIDDVRTLSARLGGGLPRSATPTTHDRAWRPPAATSSPPPQATQQVQATIVKLSSDNSKTVPLPAPPPASGLASGSSPTAAPGANVPGFIKVAVVIVSTSIPLVAAILAWRGCG